MAIFTIFSKNYLFFISHKYFAYTIPLLKPYTIRFPINIILRFYHTYNEYFYEERIKVVN